MEIRKAFRNYSCEVRAQKNEEHGTYIEGTPIVFEQGTDIGGMFREIIDKGAVEKDALKDVRFLVNHNLDMIPLARSRNNNEHSTMQLVIGDDGLSMRADLDVENNATAKELYSAVERGDISGMSFMFLVDGEEWTDLDADYPTRRITHISDVIEVSAVTMPAYEQTSISARSDAEALESAKATLESAKAKEEEERKQKADSIRERITKLMEG